MSSHCIEKSFMDDCFLLVSSLCLFIFFSISSRTDTLNLQSFYRSSFKCNTSARSARITISSVMIFFSLVITEYVQFMFCERKQSITMFNINMIVGQSVCQWYCCAYFIVFIRYLSLRTFCYLQASAAMTFSCYQQSPKNLASVQFTSLLYCYISIFIFLCLLSYSPMSFYLFLIYFSFSYILVMKFQTKQIRNKQLMINVDQQKHQKFIKHDIIISPIYLQINYMATQEPQNLNTKIIDPIPDDSTSNSSPIKPDSPTKIDKQVIKEKKKKTQALKNFLKQKTAQEIVAPTRKKSQQTEDVILEEQAQSCRVCNRDVMKKKNCGFCNLVVCNDHMRKKRKHPSTGKFTKICDDCEDKNLFQKHMKSEMKAQQALQMQQMIIASKHQQLSQMWNGKRTKMQLLINKTAQIEQQRRVNDVRLGQVENDVRNKERKLESKFIEVEKLVKEIEELERNLPRSLEEDYKALTQENEKITKQLVKYEKMCQQALKAKSKKEKQMYDEYYKWEQRQLMKGAHKPNKKKEDCLIF